MISHFWNLCRACPALDVDKVISIVLFYRDASFREKALTVITVKVTSGSYLVTSGNKGMTAVMRERMAVMSCNTTFPLSVWKGSTSESPAIRLDVEESY